MSNDSTAGCPKCAGLAACWCPPLSPAQELATNRARIGSKSVAPLSPIALDKAEEVAWENYRRAAEGFYLTGQCDDLGPAQNALRRAIVARVAQEEREKVLDKMAQMAEGYRDALKIEGVSEYTESRVRQNRDALLLVIDLLRGTP